MSASRSQTSSEIQPYLRDIAGLLVVPDYCNKASHNLWLVKGFAFNLFKKKKKLKIYEVLQSEAQ